MILNGDQTIDVTTILDFKILHTTCVHEYVCWALLITIIVFSHKCYAILLILIQLIISYFLIRL